MNDQQWEEVHEIFDSRGVSREVADARPYVPLKRGDDWVYADDGPYAVIPAAQRRATVVQDVRGADGLVMHKHPVPLKSRRLPEFPPQLRPTPDACTGSIVNHDHADPWIGDVGEHVRARHPEGDVVGLHDNYRQEQHDHDAEYGRKSVAREEHVRGREHHGVDVRGPHDNGEPGKYKLPPTPLKDESNFHVHPRPAKFCQHKPRCADDAEHTAKHVAKMREHRGYLPADGEPHPHRYRVENLKADSYGKRFDVHPLAVPLLEDAEVVLVSMEGNLKADAILTYVLRHDLPWAVVDIPSVGQWRADELDDLAAEWLAGRRVFLVCDSDWADPSKYDVQRQAFAFREYLRREIGKIQPGVGVKHLIHVAAPPESDEYEDCSRRHGQCPNPERKKVGVDDWIGGGGRLEDLVVVERDWSPKTRRWAEEYAARYQLPGANPLKKAARLAQLMTLITKPDGYGRASISSLASFSTMHRTTVAKAVNTLQSPVPARPGDLGDTAEPFERLRRRMPKRGYRDAGYVDRGGVWVRGKYDVDIDERRYADEQDEVSWVVREGYRWTERKPRRRTLGQVV